MRIAFLIPDGVGIRNYLYSRVLSLLSEHDIILIHDLPPQVVDELRAMHQIDFEEVKFPRPKESRRVSFLRKVCSFGRIHANSKAVGNKTIGDNYFFYYHQKGLAKIYFKLHDAIGKFVSLNRAQLNNAEERLAALMLHSAAGDLANEVLDEANPDIVFCTHQRSIDAAYVINAANARHIKTISVIFSWDNLPKNRNACRPKHYFLWSKHMQQEMQLYYPEIEANRLHITGTPQFEVYRNKLLFWSVEKFHSYFGVPANRIAICFSGNDLSFPSDHLYLHDLLEEMQSLPLQERPFIIVRPSPNDHSGRFASIVKKYPKDAAVHDPLWYNDGRGGWGTYLPQVKDAEILTNLGLHCAGVINIGSTMAIDFAHFNKPAIYVRYNHPLCPGYNLLLLYQQQHLKPLDEMNAVVWVPAKNEWCNAIDAIMHKADEVAPDRLQFLAMITDNITDASANIAAAMTAG